MITVFRGKHNVFFFWLYFEDKPFVGQKQYYEFVSQLVLLLLLLLLLLSLLLFYKD